MLLSISSDLTALNSDLEEGVRTTGLLVHGGGAHRAVLGSDIHNLADLVCRLGCEEGKRLHINTRVWVLLQFKPILWVLREQVADFFIVDLEVGCAH